MYICLTNRCIEKCNYCPEKMWFSASRYRAVQDMSLDLFAKILDIYRSSDELLWLCGGEIFLYPYLEQVLTMMGQQKSQMIAITSLIGDGDYIRYIAERYENSIPVWAVNIDCCDENYDLFIKNLWLICNKVRAKLFCTLERFNFSLEKETKRITDILKTFGNYEKPSVQINVDIPVIGLVRKDYDFTGQIEELIGNVTAEFPGAKFTFDQCVSYCEVNKDRLGKIPNLRIAESASYCNNYDNLILPDGSVRWCFACPKVVAGDITMFGSAWEVEKAVQDYYYRTLTQFSVSQKCRECDDLNPAKCFGGCLAKMYY